MEAAPVKNWYSSLVDFVVGTPEEQFKDACKCVETDPQKAYRIACQLVKINPQNAGQIGCKLAMGGSSELAYSIACLLKTTNPKEVSKIAYGFAMNSLPDPIAKLADMFLEINSEIGDGEAYSVAYSFLSKNHPQLALPILEKLALKGDLRAQYTYGHVLYNHRETLHALDNFNHFTRDYCIRTAYEWTCLAVQDGYESGSFNIPAQLALLRSEAELPILLEKLHTTESNYASALIIQARVELLRLILENRKEAKGAIEALNIITEENLENDIPKVITTHNLTDKAQLEKVFGDPHSWINDAIQHYNKDYPQSPITLSPELVFKIKVKDPLMDIASELPALKLALLEILLSQKKGKLPDKPDSTSFAHPELFTITEADIKKLEILASHLLSEVPELTKHFQEPAMWIHQVVEKYNQTPSGLPVAVVKEAPQEIGYDILNLVSTYLSDHDNCHLGATSKSMRSIYLERHKIGINFAANPDEAALLARLRDLKVNGFELWLHNADQNDLTLVHKIHVMLCENPHITNYILQFSTLSLTISSQAVSSKGTFAVLNLLSKVKFSVETLTLKLEDASTGIPCTVSKFLINNNITNVVLDVSNSGLKRDYMVLMNNVTSLNMAGNNIDDIRIGQVVHLTKLTYLDISGNSLTDEGAMSIAKKLTQLKTLVISTGGDLSEKGLQALRNMPGIQLIEKTRSA